MEDKRNVQTVLGPPEDDEPDGLSTSGTGFSMDRRSFADGQIPPSGIPFAPSSGRLPIPPPSSPTGSVVGAAGELTGEVLDGRYLVEKVLGEGGMGVVYIGQHKVTRRKVAIKVLRSDLARDPEILERFIQEAKAASSIGHENIVDISDFGQLVDGSTYFVMELLDGQSLGHAMTVNGVPASMPVHRILHIATQIANGLGAAHNRGIVHRDLKPDNVMLVQREGDPDFVKILDFGIAKVNTTKERLTRVGQIFGTPHYMSPEQAAGLSVDSRTDIYSLGVILYEMAAARVPFDADNFMGILTQHMYKAPASILTLLPPSANMPEGLDAIILKCLDKRPERRYLTMEELASDLQKLAVGGVPDALPDRISRHQGFVNTAPPWSGMPMPVAGLPPASGRRTAILATVIGALVALLGVMWFAMSASSRATAAASEKVALASASASAAQSDPLPSALPNPAATAVPTKHVVLKLVPESAKLTRNGAILTAPYAFDMAPTDTVALSASAPGYKPLEITLDPSNVAPMYKLTPMGGATASGVAANTTKPAPTPIAPAAAPTPPAKPLGRPKPKCSEEGADPWDCQK